MIGFYLADFISWFSCNHNGIEIIPPRKPKHGDALFSCNHSGIEISPHRIYPFGILRLVVTIVVLKSCGGKRTEAACGTSTIYFSMLKSL
jgi:hypothetical protein